MAELYWTHEALEDRRQIRSLIAADNLQAAKKLDARFTEATEKLRRFPNLGRPSRVNGSRELFPHKNYRIIYQADGDVVIILAIIHVARLWPKD